MQAALKMLRPIIHMLMRNEVSYGEFAELAKQAYVDVAAKHFPISNRKTTYSRISVLTGLSRKEVMRLATKAEEDSPNKTVNVNRTSRVITGWLKDPNYLDIDKQPLTLPLRGDHSFESLVVSYGGNVTPGAVLDELKRIEAVEVDESDMVRLVTQSYIPQKDSAEKIDILAMCANDLMRTGVHNLEHVGEEAHFQRQVVYQTIPESIAKEFKQYSNKKSLELLLDYNRWLDENRQRETVQENEKTMRLGVGIYYFEN